MAVEKSISALFHLSSSAFVHLGNGVQPPELGIDSLRCTLTDQMVQIPLGLSVSWLLNAPAAYTAYLSDDPV